MDFMKETGDIIVLKYYLLNISKQLDCNRLDGIKVAFSSEVEGVIILWAFIEFLYFFRPCYQQNQHILVELVCKFFIEQQVIVKQEAF